MDQFEARLAASLGRLADDVPAEVDAYQLAASIASAEAGRGRLLPKWALQPWRRTPLLRTAFIVVGLLALAWGLIVLAQRTAPTPIPATISGQLECSGPAWAGSSTGGVVLDCTSEMDDPRLAGIVRIVLADAAVVHGFQVRTGEVELRAPDATWAGPCEVRVLSTGMAGGSARLVLGEGGGDVLGLRLTTVDGLTWGVLGWAEAPP